MRIYETENFAGDGADTYFCYNGLDACITQEIKAPLSALLANPKARLIYRFELAMQAPALDMMLRGICIDTNMRNSMLVQLDRRREKLTALLNRFADAVWDAPLNPNSPAQLKDFFYGNMNLPVQYSFKKGAKAVAVDRKALETLWVYQRARPIVATIMALRDCIKKIGVLNAKLSENGKMHFSLNIAGTETGRWSSNKNAFGGGTNGQNITEELRKIFVSSPGYKMAYLDLEQAESRDVGLLAYMTTGDASYLDAAESGDLHTTVAKMVWPNLGWTGDPKEDKLIAETPFYRHYSYRDMAKRGGHGTNYYGQPKTMAMHLKVAPPVMEDFQKNYFTAFSCIREWHNWTASTLQVEGKLTSLLGRTRTFYGRRNSPEVLREAIAYSPQSSVGDRLNLGMWRIWKKWGKVTFKGKPVMRLLLQIHDAVLLEYQEECESWIIPALTDCLVFDVSATCLNTQSPNFGKTRTMQIPSEAQIGWNWGKQITDEQLIKKYGDLQNAARFGKFANPHGLVKFKGKDTRPPPVRGAAGLLDMRM